MVNHQIRSPLDSLRTFARFICDESQHQTSINLHAELLDQTLQGLILTLDDLDDFAQIDAGTLHLKEAPVVLRKLMEQLVKDAEQECIRKGIEFKHELQMKGSPWVRADAKRLTQIVSNLLSNSIKFTNSGEIAFKLNLDTIETNSHGNSCVIGLGLTIVKSLVELMRGEITVSSSLGKGTTMRARLPLLAAQTVSAVSH